MIPSRQARFLFLIVSLLLAGCGSVQREDLTSSLARKWSTQSITAADGRTAKRAGPDDFLLLRQQGNTRTFHYELKIEGIEASGTWELKDSSLVLSYNPGPQVHTADSVQYRVQGDKAQVVLMREGRELTRIGAGGVEPDRLVRSFRIVELTPTALAFTEKGITYRYSFVSRQMEGSTTPASVGRGLLGLVTLIAILWLFSYNRRNIPWKLVFSGLALQIIFALGVLKVDFVKDIFEMFGKFFVMVLSFTQEGSRFVFGDMVNPSGSLGFVFAFQILPTIIFFSALTSLLFYLGVLQKIVYALAWVMSKTMKLSGAESLASAANIFLGQTEAPLLVKPYISGMTRSELLCLMTGGMATIAGGVMAAYIGFLGGDDPVMRLFFAKHLLAASVMSAPAAVISAKMLLPQTQQIDDKLVVSKDRIGKNMLEAVSIGTGEGLRLAVNVGAMLLVFIALIAMVNFIFRDGIGHMTGLNERISGLTNGRYDGLTLQFLLGYICAPLSWLMGVCREDMILVGQLLGEKTILNEFVAYTTLGEMKNAGVFAEQKSVIIATYILCGFANFASIGIQIGGIGALAPDKRTPLSELGFAALLGGTVASLFTAVIVGMLI
jgi:CNT family concentrative nucleoside transporter